MAQLGRIIGEAKCLRCWINKGDLVWLEHGSRQGSGLENGFWDVMRDRWSIGSVGKVIGSG